MSAHPEPRGSDGLVANDADLQRESAMASVSPRAREKIIGVLQSQLQLTNDKLEALLA